MKKLFLVAFCAVAAVQADIVPRLQSGGVVCDVAGCDYNYVATLHDYSMLTASNTASTDDDEFLTIYDFNGYLSATVPTGWVVTTQMLGTTPNRIDASSFDDAAIENVTLRYEGAADIMGGSTFNFTLRSQYGPGKMWSDFSSRVTNIDGGGYIFNENTGPVQVPVPMRGDSPVPEPMSMALLGSGLVGLGLFRRFR